MSTKPLTAREAAFVARYRLHGEAALAAREAGYAAYQANTMGSKILHRPRIIAALREAGIEIVLPQKQRGAARAPGRIRREGLTLRQERFVSEYLVDGNATQAAIRAGLPAKNPAKAGSAMLHHRAVAREIERARAAAAPRSPNSSATRRWRRPRTAPSASPAARL
jgi:phage terminase small subunit